MAGTMSQVSDFIVDRGEVKAQTGLKVARYFTREGVNPYDEIEWELRAASIINERGKVVFEQSNVEIPKAWSQMATNVVVSKYFRGPLNTPQREKSVRQLIGRVADTITGWGRERGYFKDESIATTFNAELTWILLHQHVAFNSPVWFNVAWRRSPSA